MPSPGAVAPALVEQFRDQGFVLVPDLLTPDEVARYGAAVEAAIAERRAADTRTAAERSTYEQSFRQCQNLWEDFTSVRPLTFHPRLAEAAAALLGADAVRVFHDQALLKEPGDRRTDAHQDQPYWPIAEPRTVTAWVPFSGSTLASGALGYVPGSHTSGLRRFVDIFTGEPEDLLARPELAGREPTFLEVPAGSVAFHHGLTAHLAKANTSDRKRVVHTVIYFADGCTRRPNRTHPCVDRVGIADGDPIASDVTPVAWPRPAGDLPPRPAAPWPASPTMPPGIIPRPVTT